MKIYEMKIMVIKKESNETIVRSLGLFTNYVEAKKHYDYEVYSNKNVEKRDKRVQVSIVERELDKIDMDGNVIECEWFY